MTVAGWPIHRPDLEWAQGQLARYTYKPGYRMTLDTTGEMSYASAMYGADSIFRVAFDAPDSRYPGRTIPLMFSKYVDSGIFQHQDEQLFANLLEQFLMECERHELREWLRRDGVIYDDPHKVA